MMTLKAIYFDVDDTLYDQLLPFKVAFKAIFKDLNTDIEGVYKSSRYYSDLVFEDTESGKLSLKDMQVYRIKSALKDYDIEITDIEAALFQKYYGEKQKEIFLEKDLISLFNRLVANGVETGIITNGSSSHQRDKIRQLGIGKWVTNNAIYISSEVGSAKPKRTIFDLAAKGRSVNDFIYVGDSFPNDIVGAKSAEWKTIWFNRRGRKSPFSQIQTDYEVRTLSELIEVIELLMNST